MKDFISTLKKKLASHSEEEPEMGEEEYVEVGPEDKGDISKILVKPYSLEDFSDIKEILDSLREGYTIALINIKPLKDKDLIELKRAINKLKKTTDAIQGDIAGFGDDYIVAVPNFAEIAKSKVTTEVQE